MEDRERTGLGEVGESLSAWARRLSSLIIVPKRSVPKGQLWVNEEDFEAIRDNKPIELPPAPDINRGEL